MTGIVPEGKTPKEKEKAASVLAWISVFVASVTLILVAATFYGQWRSNRSDDLASCRSALNAELISGPQADALKALAKYGVDSSQFEQATDRINPKEFQRLIKLSRTDTDAFLNLCKAG